MLTMFSASGPNTLAAFKNASMGAGNNVSPTVKAGSGGNLTQTSGTSTSASGSPSSTGAASHMSGSIAFAGLAGAFAYLLV